MSKRGSHAVLVLPDAHFGDEDKEAIACVKAVARKLRPQRTVILGDWLDCKAFSSHPPKDLEDAAFSDFLRDEVEPCNKVIDHLQKYTSGETVFIEGNHCNRISRICASNRPLALFKDMVLPEVLLGKGRRNFKWVSYSDSLAHYEIARNLDAFHGWSFASHFTKVTAQLTKGRSAVMGHAHRQQTYVDRNPFTGEVQKVWSPGCLCNLQPKYSAHRPTGWAHGFDIIHCKDDLSHWTQYTVTIENGRCVMPDGSVIHG